MNWSKCTCMHHFLSKENELKISRNAGNETTLDLHWYTTHGLTANMEDILYNQ